MKNRICPTEETLSAYLTGAVTKNEASAIEKHLTSCRACRELVFETYEVTSRPTPGMFLGRLFSFAKKNLWGISSLFLFILSFIFRHFFIQLVTASAMLALKWIVDSKTTRTLIMVHEAWKRGGIKEANEVLEKLTPKK